MATVAETISLLSSYASSFEAGIARLSSIIDRMAAIDPADPNAATELQTIEAEYQSARSQINAQNDEIFSRYSDAFDTLSPAQQRQVNQSATFQKFNDPSFRAKGAALTARHRTLYAEKLAAITRANPPPATPTIDNTAAPAPADPAGNNALQGAASDDSGSQSPPSTDSTEENATEESPSTNAPESPESERETSGPDSDTQGVPPYPNETFVRAKEATNTRPGRRPENPLGYLASYTYQLSLYMITPDAYDAFIASGRKNINLFNEQIAGSDAAAAANRKGGAFLVAQSGGAGSDPRIPGNKFDYYIDNLSFKYYVSSKETMSPVGTIDYKFQIIEPYGFSFISNLKRAQNEFKEFIEGAQWADDEKSSIPAPKQFFILGIRFYGWDQSGRQVLGNEVFGNSGIDPLSSRNGAIFETFYEITITELKYKIDGKAVVYSISAAHPGSKLGSNTKKGIITSDKETYGSTVRDMLCGPKGLITLLNKEQQELKKNNTIKYPVTYKVRWVGDAERIALASVVSETRENKANQPASRAENTEEVNEQTDITSSPNSTGERINLGTGIPIVQGIDTIISRSKYLEDAMTLNYTDSNEYDPETNALPSKNTPKAKFTWFRITPEISNIKWDSTINDWSYDITYEIKTYLIPVIDSPYVASTTKYYGPHKRYDFWYTGENREIISYEQSLDNNYMSIVVGNTGQTVDGSSGNAENVSSAPNTTMGLDQSTAGGTPSTAAIASVKTNLYDPNSYVKAKINILGDPDFLMREVTTGSAGFNQAISRFYEDGSNSFRVNPTGGQVFIEIDFKEPVDYSANEISDVLEDGTGITGMGGTLSINDSILFWDYPAETQKIVKGISYTLVTVVSNFKNGQFTQSLEAFVNDFKGGSTLSEASRNEFNEAIATGQRLAGQQVDGQSGEPESTGLVKDTIAADKSFTKGVSLESPTNTTDEPPS